MRFLKTIIGNPELVYDRGHLGEIIVPATRIIHLHSLQRQRHATSSRDFSKWPLLRYFSFFIFQTDKIKIIRPIRLTSKRVLDSVVGTSSAFSFFFRVRTQTWTGWLLQHFEHTKNHFIFSQFQSKTWPKHGKSTNKQTSKQAAISKIHHE